jgi:hypothetical protein
MGKLTRKSAKLFAENATAAAGGIAQFGSLAAGTPNYSTDPDVIQSLSQYSDGWSAAVLGTKSPAIEDRNALDYLLSYQQAYIMQHGVPEWLDTETYYKNSYVVDSNGELRVSVIDNNTGNDPTEDNGGAYWGFAGARGSGKQVGEVYFSQSNSAEDNKGALPLFTGELISNANQMYPQFYAWVLSHTGLCVTEAQYQTAISTYGECPKYVIDDTNKTIRLPKLVNYIKMANNTDGITQSLAGLPNITASLSDSHNAFTNPTGAITLKANKTNYAGNVEETWPAGFDIDASLSSPVYGRSNTNTPAHTTVFPWVFAFNAAIPASTAQAAQFQQALSTKADIDLSNVTAPHIVQTYHNGTEWYRIWSDGWCEQGGQINRGDPNWVVNQIVVTFAKPFANTNYFVTATSKETSYTYPVLAVTDYSSSSCKFAAAEGTTGQAPTFCWEAKGYIS